VIGQEILLVQYWDRSRNIADSVLGQVKEYCWFSIGTVCITTAYATIRIHVDRYLHWIIHDEL
jgi:hypothetical protein